MRAFVPARRCASAAVLAGLSTRRVHSAAVIDNVAPAEVHKSLGVPATLDQVANAHNLPAALLEKMENPRIVALTQMDLARRHHALLTATVTAETPDFRHIEHQVELRLEKDAAKRKPVPGALKKFQETQWKDVTSLVTFYEETMYPIRCAFREYKDCELSSFHIKDVLKRGLSAFKQDFLDQQKTEKTKVEAEMKKHKDFMMVCVKDAFTTDVCNDLVNILRVGGEKYEHSRSMAIKVLEDMNMMSIPFNSLTRELMNAVTFNDGPFDDSPLLFQVIEYPERGEISLAEGSLEDVSEEILKLISNRHQTPLDDGVKLRSTVTHPNLQRSPE